MPIMPDGYYNRHNASQNYDAHLFRAGYVLQSAELNELQSHDAYRFQQLGDTLFHDGAIIRDARLIVDPATGAATGEAGALYLRGAVRGIAPRAFTIPITGAITVGAYLVETVVSHLEDPGLRDPAIGVRNYQEPGASRLQVEPRWGWLGEASPPTGAFYPIYTVVDGVVQAKDPPPQVDATTMAIARYDRESSGGYYVVSGLQVHGEANDNQGRQIYTLSEGSARVDGRAVYFPTARRLTYAAVPDLAIVEAEIHTASGAPTQTLTLRHPPVAAILLVTITAEKTVTLTHGGYSGAADALPDTGVIALIEVHQGATVYAEGDDYQFNVDPLAPDAVDWSPGGAEPATGSTYSVTYRYTTAVTPTNITETQCTVAGAVAATSIIVRYQWKIPRWDRLGVNADGQFVWIPGVAHASAPALPMAPAGLLLLASVYQRWFTAQTERQIVQDGVLMVPMNELNAMNSRLDDLYALTAEQRLLIDAALNEPTAKYGVFVDPFLDHDLRDAGLAQTAAIVNRTLTLPFVTGGIVGVAVDIAAEAHFLPCAIAATPLIAQTARTGAMLINPYLVFDPLPAVMRLQPAEDFWTETETIWGDDPVVLFILGHGEDIESTEITAQHTTALTYLREIPVTFTIDGFQATETITAITFDGVDVT